MSYGEGYGEAAEVLPYAFSRSPLVHAGEVFKWSDVLL